MKTVLLALVLIGATLALWALLPREHVGGARLEPRSRPNPIAHVAPHAELVPPAPLHAPGLVPTADPAPGETREPVPEVLPSPVRVEGQPREILHAGERLQLLDMLETRTGAVVSGRVVLSGQILRGFEVTTAEQKRPDGSWIENYDGDQPKVQGQIRNGREVGLWIYWHENGKRSAEGRYVNGERHGLWTSWHVDGSKESEGVYSYGKREGSWIDFHTGGKRQQVATYVNGELEGRVERWHANGARESEGYCVGGDLDGPWRGWYATGTTASHGDYRYGKREGRWKFLDPDGELDPVRSGRYENDEKAAD